MYRDIVCKIDGDQMFGAIFLSEPAQAARPVPPQRSGRIPAQMAGFHHGRAIPGLTSPVAAGRLASTLLQVSVSTDEKGIRFDAGTGPPLYPGTNPAGVPLFPWVKWEGAGGG